MLAGHASAVANDESWMERRDGFLIATVPKVFGEVVLEDTVAVDGYWSVLRDAREAIDIAVGQ